LCKYIGHINKYINGVEEAVKVVRQEVRRVIHIESSYC